MTRVRRLLPLVTIAAAEVACTEARPGTPAAAVEDADAASAVATCEVSREPLTLADGTDVYVEPENLASVGGGVLVAGTPTYTWEVGGGPNAILASRDAHLAARFGGGTVVVLEKPVGVRVGDVRIASLGGTRWATLFSEIGPDSVPATERLRAVWYGEHDGERWSLVEPLPLPAEGRLDFASSSSLIRAGEGLAWTTVIRLPGGGASVRHYHRADGAWRSEEVSDAWAEATAVAYGAGGVLWLAMVSQDPDLPRRQRSLRLYRRSHGWELVTRAWVALEGTQIYAPGVTALPGGVTLTWRSVNREGSIGLARVGIRPDFAGKELVVDSSAEQVSPVTTSDGVPSWVVDHVNPLTQQRELRLVRATPDGVSLVSSTPNPFRGFFAALSTAREEVLVVGPEFDPDPARPTVRSLILRLSTSCT